MCLACKLYCGKRVCRFISIHKKLILLNLGHTSQYGIKHISPADVNSNQVNEIILMQVIEKQIYRIVIDNCRKLGKVVVLRFPTLS